MNLVFLYKDNHSYVIHHPHFEIHPNDPGVMFTQIVLRQEEYKAMISLPKDLLFGNVNIFDPGGDWLIGWAYDEKTKRVILKPGFLTLNHNPIIIIVRFRLLNS